ncbi:MAG: tRNA ((37)-C2)-methylthiotransferase MiaB, partial [Chloroflexota bacterium]|nr:tRNA ((37)-C2)-methylthiotransferase MiaB [Chloroflexota bacterium]
MTSRNLPVLDIVPPAVLPAGPRDPLAPEDERLGEFRPEPRSLPSFFVWTLGCQMNKSDSEEMAGRLLAAGCPEAPAMDAADLVVINTCAIRESAEAKVVGRQGHLGRLKAENPGMRVVMTGCSVRESNRSGLARRYPAVDLFLRPDEEPELVDRLGLASAQAPVGAMARTGATTVVKGSPVSDATHLVRARAEALASGAVSRGSAISAWLPIIYGCDKTCTYCIVPFSRGPERSRPFDEILDEARALAARGFREVTLLGQNVNSYGHDLPAEQRFAHVSTARTVGRLQDREARPDLAELIRAIDGLRTADGAPAIPRLRFVTSHPWDLSDRLVEALSDCRIVCESLHLPVQSGSDSMLRRMGRQYTIDHYLERLERIRAAVPGISLSTDVIVGFCGETEAEYEATL